MKVVVPSPVTDTVLSPCRSRYDRNRGHEVVMQSNCAAAAYTLDRLRNIVRKLLYHSLRTNVVRAWGLEPQRIAAREPKSRMSTNSIMPANMSGRATCRYFILL